MNHRLAVSAIVLSLSAGSAFADLISLGPVSLSGQGLGSVNTVLTMTSPANSTTESGCVGAGVGGVTVTGASKCVSGNTGGDEQAINNSFSAASLGLTDFNNLRIIFNASEPGGNGINLDNLALSSWNPVDGSLIDAKNLPAGVTFPTTNPGVGNAGFGFKLDSAQAALENSLLATFPNMFIGLSASASDATGGLETFSVGVSGGTTVVPEPSSLLLVVSGIAGLAARRARRSKHV
jgi:PEP-CTERM motif